MPTGTHPPLQRGASLPLAGQLAERYAQRIRERLLLPGARLPSVRDCARQHGVSVHTVVAAYDQLQAAGLLEARRQRGFFVREQRPVSARPTRAPAAAATRQAPMDATALIRGMFEADAARAPGLGTLPADWLDPTLLQSALRRLQQPDALALQVSYGDPMGDDRLRAALSQRLDDLGIHAAPSQILTTNGATHALDLIIRTQLQPGDAVLVDDPGWAVMFARLAQAGIRLLPVPRTAHGPDLAVLGALAAAHSPRAYLTVSVLHNPTGHSLNLATAHQLLRLADEHDFFIVEDDSYGFLAPEHLPRLAALDGLRRVTYVSGFSKVLTPAWRVGYLAAAPERLSALTDTKLLDGLTSSAVLERAVALCLEQGRLRRHAQRLRERLASARQKVSALASKQGFAWAAPPDGLFGWLDVGVDTERLAQPLLDTGWLTAPGALFSATRSPGSLMRVNVATSLDPAFWRALRAGVDHLQGRPAP
ncbi:MULTISPECIES: PLP-dependent aminotransferase family protein [unclassified Roseateles]|uniref:aminotransferase-like domain-containing protein n=1 Tax=unclassified Roseateles TaxID=2626991 RepID=UPI0006FAAE4E|nr:MULTISPECIES: PLP-dependent aminotransferase family protein [unclassified Roseateles]KQW46366.1 GntR family transcriptional regulator [Pelomonas sp. Root405]KRA73416.1 GntR family transcriptional regulator [Pelomonas sp. Root662]